MNEKDSENRHESDSRNERDEWENPGKRDGNETSDPTHDDQARVDAQFAGLVSNLGDFGELDEMEFLVGQGEPKLPTDNQRKLETKISKLDRPQETTEDLDSNRAWVVFLTPLVSADALVALCTLSDVELVVVSTESGAVGVLELNLSEEAFGMALIADTLTDFDPSVSEVASILSQLTRVPVVVLSALLVPGTEQEPGVTGQVLTGRWTNGEFETDLPSGLVLVQMSLQIEDLLLGRVAETEAVGAVETRDIAQWKAMKMFSKGIRKPRRGRKWLPCGGRVLMKKIPKNPYVGDRGGLLPRTAHALELARCGDVEAAQVALRRALATERLMVPMPKPATSEIIKDSWGQFASPGFDLAQQPVFTSGFRAENYYEKNAPLTQSTVIHVSGIRERKPENVVNCVSESLGIIYSPVGVATPVYSSAQTFENEVEASRPALMNPAWVALATLTDGGNLWLDPVYSHGSATEAKEVFRTNPLNSRKTITLGRNALTALACGDDWLAPWDDPEIPELLARAATHTTCEIVTSGPFPAGGLNLKLRVPQGLEEHKLALKRLQRALARDLRLTVRITYFSLTPA